MLCDLRTPRELCNSPCSKSKRKDDATCGIEPKERAFCDENQCDKERLSKIQNW